MREPVILLGERLLDAVVEVLVVGEDDVATNIVELFIGGWLEEILAKQHPTSERVLLLGSVAKNKGGTHETLGGGISASKTTGLLGGVHKKP